MWACRVEKENGKSRQGLFFFASLSPTAEQQDGGRGALIKEYMKKAWDSAWKKRDRGGKEKDAN